MARKENALDLGKFIDKDVRVKLTGGREGTLCAELLNSFCMLSVENEVHSLLHDWYRIQGRSWCSRGFVGDQLRAF